MDDKDTKFRFFIRLIHWIASWLDVLCGLVSIITFTFVRPGWDMQFRGYANKKLMKYKMRKNNE